MRILVAADMEGITGVTTWDQVTAGHSEYERFRRLMTEDVNAAARGAYEAGASQVTVTDGHSGGSNILVDALDPRVRLFSGSPSPLSMVQGVEEVDGVLYIGYHARVGTPRAILDHTWSSRCVRNLWLNGTLTGEYGLNAAIAGHFGVPVLLVSGDQTACAQVQELLGEQVEIAVVKYAVGRFSAQCLTPEATHELIQNAAQRAITRLVEGKAPSPFVLSTPVTVRVEFATSDMADRAMRLPRSERDGTSVRLQVEDMQVAYQAFIALVALAAG